MMTTTTMTTMIAMAIWRYSNSCRSTLVSAKGTTTSVAGREKSWTTSSKAWESRWISSCTGDYEPCYVLLVKVMIMNPVMSWLKSWWWIYQLCLQQMNITTAVSLFNVVFLRIILCPRKIVKKLANLYISRQWLLLFISRRWLLQSKIFCNPRMEDTERLRSRMRERRRREVFEKAEKEEEREKAIFARFLLKTMLLKCCRGFLKCWRSFLKGWEEQKVESTKRGWSRFEEGRWQRWRWWWWRGWGREGDKQRNGTKFV